MGKHSVLCCWVSQQFRTAPFLSKYHFLLLLLSLVIFLPVDVPIFTKSSYTNCAHCASSRDAVECFVPVLSVKIVWLTSEEVGNSNPSAASRGAEIPEINVNYSSSYINCCFPARSNKSTESLENSTPHRMYNIIAISRKGSESTSCTLFDWFSLTQALLRNFFKHLWVIYLFDLR
ncbi:hypothetical protein M514_03115 [Trichuris suis]|uniref:Uncharacterized protein n=1 Tax=Trichuris suis TaxID=68888 RepID=A0A085MFJ5_9BILA|nr:hypothetical protein M513_03115 [Trichuris suis]KFD68252.1 hypothetical protein M514_03115 [Trichuris suis]